MSPWEILGWLLVFIVGFAVIIKGLILLLSVWEDAWPAWKKSRKRKRADKGKVICESIEWEGTGPDRVRVLCPDKAEWRGGFNYSQYLCDEHTRRSRDNRAPLAWTEAGKRRSANAPTVVRSPRTTRGTSR